MTDIKNRIRVLYYKIKVLILEFLHYRKFKNEEQKLHAYNVFSEKLKYSLKKYILWYNIYKNNIPDSLLMIYDFEDKLKHMLELVINTDNLANKEILDINYKIHMEIVNYIKKTYNQI